MQLHILKSIVGLCELLRITEIELFLLQVIIYQFYISHAEPLVSNGHNCSLFMMIRMCIMNHKIAVHSRGSEGVGMVH